MIKYSIVMPYYKRTELDITLNSFLYHYKDRKDFEVIIVEDSKNNDSKEDHEKLLELIKKYNTISITTFVDPKLSYNPASKFNKGVQRAQGSVIILTSPEVVHKTNILSQLDKEDLSNLYIVCACLAVNLIKKDNDFSKNEFEELRWYQHSIHRNAKYHFCSVILKDNFFAVGGFNEIFCNGIAYEDDNFVQRVQRKLSIIPRDDLLTYHIEHDRSYSISRQEYLNLCAVNEAIWREQLRTGNF